MPKIHGNYKLESTGDIVIVRFYDTWNEECSKEFFQEYKTFVLGKNFCKFGVIADLRCFEGATREAVMYIANVSQWGSDNGQIARAQLIDTEFKFFTINDLQTLDSKFPINNFDDEHAAILWLREQGLKG